MSDTITIELRVNNLGNTLEQDAVRKALSNIQSRLNETLEVAEINAGSAVVPLEFPGEANGGIGTLKLTLQQRMPNKPRENDVAPGRYNGKKVNLYRGYDDEYAPYVFFQQGGQTKTYRTYQAATLDFMDGSLVFETPDEDGE